MKRTKLFSQLSGPNQSGTTLYSSVVQMVLLFMFLWLLLFSLDIMVWVLTYFCLSQSNQLFLLPQPVCCVVFWSLFSSLEKNKTKKISRALINHPSNLKQTYVNIFCFYSTKALSHLTCTVIVFHHTTQFPWSVSLWFSPRLQYPDRYHMNCYLFPTFMFPSGSAVITLVIPQHNN